MALIVPGLVRPIRLTRRARAISCTLSRLATDSTRMPSAGPRRTSVERPRIVDVTGAAITECSSWAIGSRLRTTIGRILSSRASHTSPRRGALSAVFGLGIEGFPVRRIGQAAAVTQEGNTPFRGVGRIAAVRGDISAQLLGLDQAVEGQVADLGG